MSSNLLHPNLAIDMGCSLCVGTQFRRFSLAKARVAHYPNSPDLPSHSNPFGKTGHSHSPQRMPYQAPILETVISGLERAHWIEVESLGPIPEHWSFPWTHQKSRVEWKTSAGETDFDRSWPALGAVVFECDTLQQLPVSESFLFSLTEQHSRSQSRAFPQGWEHKPRNLTLCHFSPMLFVGLSSLHTQLQPVV